MGSTPPIKNYVEIIKVEKENNMAFTTCAYGRYGELFQFEQVENGSLVTCYELDMVKKPFTREEESKIINEYQIKGVPDFDKSDKEKMKSRALNMHKGLIREYGRFINAKDAPKYYFGIAELVIYIYRKLVDATVLGLSEEEYLNWFIKGESEVNQEYIDFMNHIKTIFISKNK